MELHTARAFGIDQSIKLIDGYCAAGAYGLSDAKISIDQIDETSAKAVFVDCTIYYLMARVELDATGVDYRALGAAFYRARNGGRFVADLYDYPDHIAERLTDIAKKLGPASFTYDENTHRLHYTNDKPQSETLN